MSPYWVELTDEVVEGTDPALVTRYLWRARRRYDRLSKDFHYVVGSYRWGILIQEDGRYAVVALQNRLHKMESRYGQNS